MVAASLGLGPGGSDTVSQPEAQEGGLPGGGGIVADKNGKMGNPSWLEGAHVGCD